jgi:hypothetical protein
MAVRVYESPDASEDERLEIACVLLTGEASLTRKDIEMTSTRGLSQFSDSKLSCFYAVVYAPPWTCLSSFCRIRDRPIKELISTIFVSVCCSHHACPA